MLIPTNILKNDRFLSVANVQFVQSENSAVAWDNVSGQVSYTPNVDFRGIDQFRYFFTDDRGEQSETALVNVEVVIGQAQKPSFSPMNGIGKHLVWQTGNTDSVTVSVASSPGANIIMEFADRETGEVTTDVMYTGSLHFILIRV